MPQVPGFAVFRGINKLFRRFQAYKFQNYNSVGFPVAFKFFGFSSTCQVLSSIGGNSRRCKFLVFLITFRIIDRNICNHECTHFLLLSFYVLLNKFVSCHLGLYPELRGSLDLILKQTNSCHFNSSILPQSQREQGRFYFFSKIPIDISI